MLKMLAAVVQTEFGMVRHGSTEICLCIYLLIKESTFKLEHSPPWQVVSYAQEYHTKDCSVTSQVSLTGVASHRCHHIQ